MVGWHHCLHEHEFEQTLGGGEGQGSQCAVVLRIAELDTTEWLNSSHIINLKRTWEKLLPAAVSLLPLKTQLMSESYPPGMLASELCWSWLLLLEPLLLVTASLLEALLSWIQALLFVMWTSPSELQQENSLGGSDVQDAGLGSSAHTWHHAPWAAWRGLAWCLLLQG